MFNTAIMGDCFPDTIISRLHENIKHLVAANEDKQLALEDARTEVKGLKEFIETVSIAGLLHGCRLLTVILCVFLMTGHLLSHDRGSLKVVEVLN